MATKYKKKDNIAFRNKEVVFAVFVMGSDRFSPDGCYFVMNHARRLALSLGQGFAVGGKGKKKG